MSAGLVLALAAPVFFYRLGADEVCHVIEERVAVTSREMWRAGEWIIPTMNGERRLQKPPLAYWLPHLAALLRGTFDELTLRAPFALAALGALLLMIQMGRAVIGGDGGLIAALVLLTSALFIRQGHSANADELLLLFTAGAWCLYLRARRRGALDRAPSWEPLAFYLCLGLGFLAKGPVVLALTALPILVEAALLGSRAPLRPLWSLPGIGLFLFLSALWPGLVLLRVSQEPEGISPLRQWFLESIGKMVPSEGMEEGYSYLRHPEPWYFYLARIPSSFGPWTLILPFACWRQGRALAERIRWPRPAGGSSHSPAAGAGREAPLETTPLVWFLSMLAFFSLISEKKTPYMVPLVLPGALMIAAASEFGYARARGFLRRACGWLVIPAAAGLLLSAAGAAAWPRWRDPVAGLAGREAAALIEGLLAVHRWSLIAIGLIALGGLLLVWRLLRSERALLPFLGLALTLSLALLPYANIHLTVKAKEWVGADAAAIRSLIRPGQPIYAVGRLPSGLLFYLDHSIDFFNPERPGEFQELPPGAGLLVSAATLKDEGGLPAAGGAESGTLAGQPLAGPLEGYWVARVIRADARRERERAYYLEKRS